MSLYTEPRYLEAAPTTALLSETRPTSLSAPTLSAINATLDELLQLFIHASLIPPTGSSPPSVNGTPPMSAGPLGPKDVYTTERFAAGVRRVLGPNFGKNVILEAELAVRELLKMSNPSLRGDGALRKGGIGEANGSSVAATTQADDLFRLLREWVMAISGLGASCPPTGPMNITNHLLALTPPPAPPLGTMSPQITFIVALYAERCLFFLGEYLSRAVGRVTERGQNESAGLAEVEAAFAEDDTIWSWLRGMRVRQHIESEVAALKSKTAGVPNQSPSISSSLGAPSKRISTAPSSFARRPSGESSLTYGVRPSDRKGSVASTFGLGIADQPGGDSFEELMQSGKTMKVSLTPDRLRTVEKFGRSGSALSNSTMTNSTSMPSLAGSGSPTSTVRRLGARPAVAERSIIDEAEEGGKKGDALTTMLNTPPPWQADDDARAARKQSTTSSDAFGPMSVAMRAQDSQNSVQTMSSTMSSGSDIDAYHNQSPRTRQRVLKAKDERKDLAHERQINHDLADFFSNSPPPPSGSSFPTSASASTVREEPSSTPVSPAAPTKKAKKGFGSFFTSKPKKTEQEPPSARRDSLTSQATTSSAGKTSRTRLNSVTDSALASAAAMRAAGFSDAAIRTASYSPPPNLAPSPSESQRRVSKVTYSTAPPTLTATGNERVSSIPLSTRSPRSSPPAPATPVESAAPSLPSEAESGARAVNGGPRGLTSPSSLATISTPPAALPANLTLAASPSQLNEPSPRLSLAPSFKTAHEEELATPTNESFGVTPGLVAGGGIAALAGAASAALFGSKNDKDGPDAKEEQPRVSAELKRSPPMSSGLVMASQELGYRSSNESMDRPPHTRALSDDSVSTAGPSPTSPEAAAPVAVLANGTEANEQERVDPLESSATLEDLKTRMSSAQSPSECVAMLEAFIAQQSKEQPKTNGIAEVTPVVAEQKKPSAEERRAELQRHREQAQERMNSWVDELQSSGGWAALRTKAELGNEEELPVPPKSPMRVKPLKLVQKMMGNQENGEMAHEEQDQVSEKEAEAKEA